MRIPSLLSLALVVALFSTGCTKDDVLETTATGRVEAPAAYGVSYSEWTPASKFSWSLDESGGVPFRQSTWDAPELTQELINSGNVLIYVRANSEEAVQAMPVLYTNGNTPGETDHFNAEPRQGAIHMTHAKLVDGNYVRPESSNATFRYIIITDVTPPANGRPRTLSDLQAMSYEEVVIALGIPE